MDRLLLRITTLNVWAQHGDWPARRRVLLEGFRELRPDLVALQETIQTAAYDQVADILGPEFRVVHQARRAADGGGVSIASRWPLGQVRELDLHLTPRAGDFPCTTLVAEILAPEPLGPLLFINHFPNWQLDFELEREQQAVAAARFIDEVRAGREMHVILAGDLNADPNAASMRFWSGRQSLDGLSVCYRDAWESVRGQETVTRTRQTTHSTPREIGRSGGSTTSSSAATPTPVRHSRSTTARGSSTPRSTASGRAITSASGRTLGSRPPIRCRAGDGRTFADLR